MIRDGFGTLKIMLSLEYSLTEHVFHRLCETTSLTFRVVSHAQLECFVVGPDSSIENLKSGFSCFGCKGWKALLKVCMVGRMWTLFHTAVILHKA